MAHETSSLTSAQLFEKLRKLRELTSEWTLSEDDKLCTVLNELSRSLVSRVDDTLCRLSASTSATTRALVNVANIDTHLASFANDQFIESRVCDEPCIASVEPPPSVKKALQRQEETVENIREAVSLSFMMIKSHFKRIEMRPEDFDEDDDPTFVPDPVFEPFDSHLSRPLPLLVGTNDWNASSSAGVRDIPVELEKVPKDEVVIGLPVFVQPHLATVATSGPQPTQPQNMGTVHNIDEETERAVARMAGSADSRRSDHSGLFSSDSTDDEGTLTKDHSRNKGSTWRGVTTEPYIPREPSGASRRGQVEEEPATKQAFVSTAAHSPTSTRGTSTPPGSNDLVVHSECESAKDSVAPSIRSSEASTTNLFASKNPLFGDSDSDGDMFTDANLRKPERTLTISRNGGLPEEMRSSAHGDFLGTLANQPISSTTHTNVCVKHAATLSNTLFDDDSDYDDLFANPASHLQKPADSDSNADQMSSVSEKAVFRSGIQLAPDFANRLSGLILTASKQASAAHSSSVVSKEKPIKKASLNPPVKDAVSTDATKSMLHGSESAIHSNKFKSHLSAMLMPKASGSAIVKSDTLSHVVKNSDDISDIAVLPSIVKTRTKGPVRRAPTRAKVAAVVTSEPEETSKQDSYVNGTVSSSGVDLESTTAETSAAIVQRSRLSISNKATVRAASHANEGISVTKAKASDQPSALFSDSDDDIFAPVTSRQATNKIPKQVAEKQNSSEGVVTIKARRYAPEEQHCGDITAVGKKANAVTNTAEVAPQSKYPATDAKIMRVASQPTKSIFASDDEDDDDIFAVATKPSRSTSIFQCKSSVSRVASSAAVTFKAVSSKNSTVPVKRGIFDDDSDSDKDLFK